MSDWHTELSDEQIEEMKTNSRPFGLIDKWMQTAFHGAAKDPTIKLYYFEGTEWQDHCLWTITNYYCAYRLRPDWKRPEKEPKEQGRWEYHDIKRHYSPYNDAYWGIGRGEGGWDTLSSAINCVVGFGGIEFAEVPGHWYMFLGLLSESGNGIVNADYYGMGSPRYKPATPSRCRFWIEGGK